jgi:hypothetical protein
MKIKIDSIKENPVNLLRKMGYIFQRKDGDEMSFVRPLARSGYPRFHAYIHLDGIALIINLHLDQKKETYGNAKRHHGEYEDSEIVKNEALRIQQSLV